MLRRLVVNMLSTKQRMLVGDVASGLGYFKRRDQRSLELLARIGVIEKEMGSGGIYPPRWRLTMAGNVLVGFAVPERPKLELVR